MLLYRNRLLVKLKESLKAVLPIIGVVLLLSFTIAPMPSGILLSFILEMSRHMAVFYFQESPGNKKARRELSRRADTFSGFFRRWNMRR